MPTGKVKFFNEDKGYGFIGQDEGEDIFFHISRVVGQKILDRGQRVEYEIVTRPRGPQAVEVREL